MLEVNQPWSGVATTVQGGCKQHNWSTDKSCILTTFCTHSGVVKYCNPLRKYYPSHITVPLSCYYQTLVCYYATTPKKAQIFLYTLLFNVASFTPTGQDLNLMGYNHDNHDNSLVVFIFTRKSDDNNGGCEAREKKHISGCLTLQKKKNVLLCILVWNKYKQWNMKWRGHYFQRYSGISQARHCMKNDTNKHTNK